MAYNLLTFDPATRTGFVHDTEHDMDMDYFYAFDASNGANTFEDADCMLIAIPAGVHVDGLSTLVANGYRNSV